MRTLLLLAVLCYTAFAAKTLTVFPCSQRECTTLASSLANTGIDVRSFTSLGVFAIQDDETSLRSGSIHVSPYCPHLDHYAVWQREFAWENDEAFTTELNTLQKIFHMTYVPVVGEMYILRSNETMDVFNFIGRNTVAMKLLEHPYVPAPERYTEEIKAKNPVIEKILSAVDPAEMKKQLDYLTSESIFTRNSYSQGAIAASKYLRETYESYGFTATLESFRTDMSDNVVAILQGSELPNEVVVLGAHYDSRGPSRNSPTQRAPGANDDGSGTALLLEFARLVKSLDIKFRRTIHIVSFGGEEQGLIGSRAYANKLASQNVNVHAMLQSDMVAYRRPGEVTQLAFPSTITTPWVQRVCEDTTRLYVPAITVGITPACCSDHQSFIEAGFPATQLFERNGPIADPQYHKSEDIVDRLGYDIEGELYQITKALIASACELSEVV